MSEETLPINEYKQNWKEQPMLRPKIGSVVINVSTGAAGAPLDRDRAKTIVNTITGQQPTETKAKQTWRNWGIRKHQPVGVKVTIRGDPAYELLMRLLHAKEYKLKKRSIDKQGNFAFGIHEHIDIPGLDYDPTLGIIGMDVIVQMERSGYRVKKRSYQQRKMGKKHFVTPVETQIFLVDQYGIEII
ncbi:MAG: 50S ribosomal protein L5 [Candidatus Kariarchaeaceae archaeon]|jgi:large subunit ribosomal protein L5